MPNAQDLRLVLIVNNLSSLIIGFANTNNSWDQETVSLIAAIFHLLSWLYNFWMICRSWWQRRNIIFKHRRRGGYQSLPMHADRDMDEYEGITRNKPRRSFCYLMLGMLLDMGFCICFLTLFIISCTRIQYTAETFETVGDVVAAFVHGFFVLYAFRRMIFGKYTIEISLNVRDRIEADAEVVDPVPASKERQSQTMSQTEQPSSSPQPYKGSPSTKPSVQETGLIRLTDPVDTDALIGDHD